MKPERTDFAACNDAAHYAVAEVVFSNQSRSADLRTNHYNVAIG